MLESMNDEQILHLSSIYYHARTCPHTWWPVTGMPIMPFRVNVRS
jgi:hypothetical protein